MNRVETHNKKFNDFEIGLDVTFHKSIAEPSLAPHWHEFIQIYYFIEGEGIIECDGNIYKAFKSNFAIINGKEMHYIKSISDNAVYYVLRFDITSLYSPKIDSCQKKYIAPIGQNMIIFSNIISDDLEMESCVSDLVEEYKKKTNGYELIIKAKLFELIYILIQKHMKFVRSEKELKKVEAKLKRFECIFQYILNNYNEKISISHLSEMIGISDCHFCRIFKQISGKTVIDHINSIRLEKACEMLLYNQDNITEIAIKCGFDDMNYFSKTFKKYFHMSPREFRKKFTDKMELFD